MTQFIEVNKTGERSIVNLDKIKRIIPVINGVGCVIHFEQGTINVSESYEVIRDKLIGVEQAKTLNGEVSPKKKETITKS